jgi:hypothetical protein
MTTTKKNNDNFYKISRLLIKVKFLKRHQPKLNLKLCSSDINKNKTTNSFIP